MAKLKRWAVGNVILIVGQSRAGKTCFREYLRHGLLDDEKPTSKTQDPVGTTDFTLTLGKDKSLRMEVWSVEELPGQYGPVAHAALAFDERPNAIIIISDLTAPLTGDPEKAAGAWLQEFCQHLEKKWIGTRRGKNPLQSMILVLNKRDKVNPDAITKRTRQLQKILEKELRTATSNVKGEIPIMPCVSVTNPDGEKPLLSVITEMAKRLAGEV